MISFPTRPLERKFPRRLSITFFIFLRFILSVLAARFCCEEISYCRPTFAFIPGTESFIHARRISNMPGIRRTAIGETMRDGLLISPRGRRLRNKTRDFQ